MAELRLEVGSLVGVITKVTVESEGITSVLVRNTLTNTFDGSLFLTSGTHEVVGRGFDGARLIGQSNPVAVAIEPGAVTRVELQILDLTGTDPARYGPIVDSLTFPTTVEVQQPAAFTISAISPTGDPVTYAWSSSCADATFSAPEAAATTWTKPSPGSCLISVVTTSNDIEAFRNFMIVVFPAGSGAGAVTVNGRFIFSPFVEQSFDLLSCFGSSLGGSCDNPIASPTVTPYTVTVTSWGNSPSGTIDLSDDCGGSFGVTQRLVDSVTGFWLPPAAGGVCFLTLRAVNGAGAAGQQKLAVLVRPGTPATAQPPQLFAVLDANCQLTSSSPPPLCGVSVVGSTKVIRTNVVLNDGHPGLLTITDDCVGPLPVTSYFQPFTLWTTPDVPGAICTVRVTATTVEGSSTEVAGSYQVL